MMLFSPSHFFVYALCRYAAADAAAAVFAAAATLLPCYDNMMLTLCCLRAP